MALTYTRGLPGLAVQAPVTFMATVAGKSIMAWLVAVVTDWASCTSCGYLTLFAMLAGLRRKLKLTDQTGWGPEWV